jgi:hypothetical protein
MYFKSLLISSVTYAFYGFSIQGHYNILWFFLRRKEISEEVVKDRRSKRNNVINLLRKMKFGGINYALKDKI